MPAQESHHRHASTSTLYVLVCLASVSQNRTSVVLRNEPELHTCGPDQNLLAVSRMLGLGPITVCIDLMIFLYFHLLLPTKLGLFCGS